MDDLINFFGLDANNLLVIMQLISSIFAIIFTIVTIIRFAIKKIKAKKDLMKDVKEMEENKNSQMEEEKEMAKFYFLCDKCGKQVLAENGKRLTIYNKAFDLCGDCDKAIREKISNVANAKRELENAQLVYNSKKAKLEELQKSLENDIGTQTNSSIVTESKNSTDDIKAKLGI